MRCSARSCVRIHPVEQAVTAQVVKTEEGESLAAEHNIRFFETSAKSNINVEEAFQYLVEAVCERMFKNPPAAGGKAEKGTVDIAEGGREEKKKGCC